MLDWNRIVREHGPAVFGAAWRILGHAADAEDVVQETFLEAHRWVQSRPVRHWNAFLRRVATCRALDRLRQRKPLCSLENIDLPSTEDGPEEIAVGRELAQRLREGIAQLPERESAVFCMRHFEELSYQQIAEALDVSSGAVAVALHKARLKLEALLVEAVQGE